MIGVLLFVSFVQGIAGRVIPREELEHFMNDVLFSAQTEIPARRTLPSHDYSFSFDLYGMPYNFKFKTSNPVLIGPKKLVRVGRLVGSELPNSSSTNGEALVEGRIHLGTIEVVYPELDVDIFGLKYKGPAGMSILNANVDVTVKVYRDALVKCYVTVLLTELDGDFVMNLGDSSFQKSLFALAEYLMIDKIYPYKLLQYFLFPDVNSYLEGAIKNAFKRMAC